MLEENEQLPDWLIELRDQQIAEQTQPQPEPEPQSELELQPEEPLQMTDDLPEPIEQEEPIEGSQEPPPPRDMLDDLREQIIQAEEKEQIEEKGSILQSITTLQPAQRLIVAILLFLNVAVCGCMGLIMAGRVALPF